MMGRAAAVAASAFALVACNSGGTIATPYEEPPPDLSPGGVFYGVEVVGGDSVADMLALVTESGEGLVVREDGLYARGHVHMDQATASGSFVAGFPVGETFEDGSQSATGGFNGTVREGESLTYAFRRTTTAGTEVTGEAILEYSSVYEQGSSLSAVAGTYTSGSNTATIGVTGSLYAEDWQTGCVANGNVTPAHRDYNLYRVYFWYENCEDDHAVLNGAEFRGLFMLDGNMAIGGALGTADGVDYAVPIEYAGS